MEKYEVHIPDEVQATLNELNNEWISFQETLTESEVMLKKHKVCVLNKPIFVYIWVVPAQLLCITKLVNFIFIILHSLFLSMICATKYNYSSASNICV